jgi:hypothetical protein
MNVASMQNRILQVASSFTSIPIAKTLRPLVVDPGIADDLRFAQYAQMTEAMLGVSAGSGTVIGTIVLVRVEDWLRDDVKAPGFAFSPEVAETFRQKLRTRVDEFARLLAVMARRGKPVWFLACPSDGWIADKYKLESLCRTQTNLLGVRVRNLKELTVIAWPTSWASDPHDRSSDRLGQIPYTPDAFRRLGEILGQQLSQGLKGKAQGEASRGATGSAELAAYMAGLKVHIRLTPVEKRDCTHVDRLLRTAAAFSLTGEKPDLADAEVDALLDPGRCLLISVSDRLSDHGPSGMVAYRVHDDSLVVDAMALSCPVLGKQVEYATVTALAQLASHHGLKNVIFEYRPSGRNQPTLTFLQSLADTKADNRYVLPVNLAAARIRGVAPAPGSWTIELPSYLPPLNGE